MTKSLIFELLRSNDKALYTYNSKQHAGCTEGAPGSPFEPGSWGFFSSKRLTASLNPLDATFTKTAGWEAVSNPVVFSRSPIFGTHFQVPFPISPAFATLTKTPRDVGLFFPFWEWAGRRRSIVVRRAHGTTCSAKELGSPFGPRHSLELRQVRIRHRNDQQGQQQTECLPANDGYRDRRALLRTGADADSHGDQPGDNGKRGHQDGPQAHAIRFQDRLAHRHAFDAQPVGVIHLQDAVLFHNAEQQKHSQGAPQAQRASRDPQ